MTLATTEKGFQAACVELARILQWRVFFVRDSRGSPSGWAAAGTTAGAAVSGQGEFSGDSHFTPPIFA